MKNNIFVATPCFGCNLSVNYVNSLLEFCEQKISFSPFFLHDSLITRARNELITQFYENKDKFTHLLWLDADVFVPGKGLKKLLNKNVDVIGAPVPIKELSSVGAQSVRKVYEKIDLHFYKAECVATGCLLMSKKSVLDLLDNSDYYYVDDKSDRKIFNAFETNIRGKELMSEDWNICYKLRDLNYDIHIDSSFPVSHFGSMNFFREALSYKENVNQNFSYK